MTTLTLHDLIMDYDVDLAAAAALYTRLDREATLANLLMDLTGGDLLSDGLGDDLKLLYDDDHGTVGIVTDDYEVITGQAAEDWLYDHHYIGWVI